MPLAQVWTHYKIGKLNLWTFFCNVCINFLNSPIWKEIMCELNEKPSSVITFLTDFSFQNLIFWNLFEFSVTEITSKSISSTFWIQILPNKFCSSRSFPVPPTAHSNSSEIFSYNFYLIFSEEILQYSKSFAPQVQCHGTKPMHPSLVRVIKILCLCPSMVVSWLLEFSLRKEAKMRWKMIPKKKRMKAYERLKP